jgi:hypothetical protein
MLEIARSAEIRPRKRRIFMLRYTSRDDAAYDITRVRPLGLANRSGSGDQTIDVTIVATLPFALEVDGVVIAARADVQDDTPILQVGFIKFCWLFGNASADQRADDPAGQSARELLRRMQLQLDRRSRRRVLGSRGSLLPLRQSRRQRLLSPSPRCPIPNQWRFRRRNPAGTSHPSPPISQASPGRIVSS